MFSLNSMRTRYHNTATGKTIVIGGGLAMLVLAISGLGANLMNRTPPSNTNSANTISANVATVNGVPVTRLAYSQAIDQAKAQAEMTGQTPTPFTMSDLRMRALTQVMNTIEMTQIAQQAGIVATPADLAAERDKDLAQYKQELGLPANATDDQVNAALQGNNMSIQTILPDSSLQSAVLIDKYQDSLKASLAPTAEQVLDYFRHVHTRHILISNRTHPDAQAKAQAQELIKELQAGANFATLVKEYSDDKASVPSGGDDGIITSTTPYVPQFLDAALQLKTGQITPQPIYSPQYGYFIIQALSSTLSLPKDFDKNKAMYTQQVAEQMQQTAEQDALSQASQNADVVIIDPLLKGYRAIAGNSPTQSDFASAMTDFQQALTTADYAEKPEIYAMISLLYAQRHDTKDQIAALNSAIQAQDDPTLRLALGDAYKSEGDIPDALSQFQTASEHAYNDPGIHSQLQTTFQQMGKTALADREKKWLAQYAQSQRQASAGFGSGMPLQPTQ